jgi:cell division protease FtsH
MKTAPTPRWAALLAGASTLWVWVVLAFLAYNAVFYLVPHGSRRTALPYTVFRQQLAAGNVGAITLAGDHVLGVLTHPVRWPSGTKGPHVAAFQAVLPRLKDPTLWPLLLAHHVTVTSTGPGNPWLAALLINALPMLLIAGVLVLDPTGHPARRAGRGRGGVPTGNDGSRRRPAPSDDPWRETWSAAGV